jgi:hypothetical protein
MNTTTSEWAAAIARKMASLGFEPARKWTATHVEYQKTYIDPLGRRAAANVMFRKDPSGRREAQLDGFVVTVQAVIPPIIDSIAAQAPSIVRKDLSDITQALGDADPPDHTGIVKEACASCGIEVEEYYLQNKKKVCRRCYG